LKLIKPPQGIKTKIMTIYAKGITVKEGKFGFKVSVKVQDFIQFLNENVNEKGYVNLDLNKRKEMGKYGETHYFKVDDWKPTGQQQEAPQQQQTPPPTMQDDLPF